MNRICISAAAAICGFVVHADVWYFAGNEASSDTGAFNNPAKWQSADGTAATAFSAADTYVLTNLVPGVATATAHGLRAHGGTFANGARLELCASNNKAQTLYMASDSTPANPTVFARGLLLGKYGEIRTLSANVTNVISGDVALVAPNGGSIPRIQAGAKDTTLVFNGAMTGADGRAMYVFPSDDYTKRNFTVKFLGNVSWGGELYVRDQWNEISANCEYNTRLVFGSISFKPTFRIDGRADGGRFNSRNLMRFAVDTVNDMATFLNGIDTKLYPLHHDTYLEFPVDVATGKAGKMVLEKQLYGRTNDTIGVILAGNLFNGSATNRFALLSAPVAYPLDAAKFHLVKDAYLEGAGVRFEVVDDASYSTLYAVVPPMVRYVKSDSTSQDAGKGSYIESADGWSDGATPQPDHSYLVVPESAAVHKVIRTPDSNIDASYTFPGQSLTIASNASLRCYLHGLNVSDLRMLGGSALYAPRCGSDSLDVSGSIDISGTVRVGTVRAYSVNFNNAFTGSGTIDFCGSDERMYDGNAYAGYGLYGDNSRFTGKMIVRTHLRAEVVDPNFVNDFGNLYITNGAALGADFASPVPDALVLTDYARLYTSADVTIPKDSNRGITVKGVAVIWSSVNAHLRIETPLTVDGSCYKQGMGALTLAGRAISANGDGTDRLLVTNGLLRVASAQAINGLSVYFAKGTWLQIVPNLDDAEFTAKGVDVSALDAPITLEGSLGGKLPLVSVPTEERPEAAFGTTEYGLLTVKATSADAMRSMLPETPPVHFGKAHVQWTESADAVAQTVTFGVRYMRCGMRVVFR